MKSLGVLKAPATTKAEVRTTKNTSTRGLQRLVTAHAGSSFRRGQTQVHRKKVCIAMIQRGDALWKFTNGSKEIRDNVRSNYTTFLVRDSPMKCFLLNCGCHDFTCDLEILRKLRNFVII